MQKLNQCQVCKKIIFYIFWLDHIVFKNKTAFMTIRPKSIPGWDDEGEPGNQVCLNCLPQVVESKCVLSSIS